MAETVIESLITKLGFDIDEKELKEFNKGLDNAVKGLTAIVASATVAAAGIFAFTKTIAESNDELGKFSQIIGIDIKALQELGFAAELNGGSVDSMNSSLANLSKIASEASRGLGAGVEVFGILGISATDANGKIKQTDKLFEEVADRVSKLGSQAEKLEFASKLGIGEDLILTLQQGSEALRKQRAEAKQLGFIISKEDAKVAADFNDELLRITKSVKGVASVIGTKLAKQMIPILKQFTEWFKINKELITQNISKFFQVLNTAIGVVWRISVRLFRAIDTIVKAMGGWKTVIATVTAAWAIFNANLLLVPILIAGLGAAILLILEDIITFAKGGDSVFGSLIAKIPILDKLLKGLLDTTEQVAGSFAKLLLETAPEIAAEIRTKVEKGEFRGLNEGEGEGIKGLLNVFNPPGVQSPNSVQNKTNNSVSNNTNNVTINVQEGTKQNVQSALESVFLKAEANLKTNVDF